MAAIVKCYVNKTHNIDFNVDQPNPNWDEDIIRVYYIRRLQRQIQQMQGNEEDLTRQIKEQESENIRMFINELEPLKYDQTKNEFSTTECVICMDEFKDGDNILRIPVCRHFFHEHCIKQWFESK